MSITSWIRCRSLDRPSTTPVLRAPLRDGPARTRLQVEHLEDRTVPSVNLSTNFVGMNFSQSSGGYTPPDTIAAAGPTAIVEAVNNSLAFYSKSTGALLQPIQSMRNFFRPLRAGSTLSDPFVAYDPQTGKFVVSLLDVGRGNFLVAVSVNSDPTKGFIERSVTDSEAGGFFGLLADFPRFGENADSYVWSFNMFDNLFGTFDHVQILALKKSSFNSKNSPLVGFKADRYGADSSTIDFTMAPANMHGDTQGGHMWFVEENLDPVGNTTNSLRVVQMVYTYNTGGGVSGYFQDYAPIAVNPYDQPPAATQPGTGAGLIQANDTRVLNAVWMGGRLLAAQAVGETDGLDHARFYEISTLGSTPTLTQQGDVTPGQAGANTYFPSIEIAANGTLGMTFMESSPTEYMSMYVTGQVVGGAMQAPALAKAGLATYTGFDGSPYRAGDFSGISIDPTTGNFWAANEYATAASGTNWGTWIASFSVTASGPLGPLAGLGGSSGTGGSAPPFSQTAGLADSVLRMGESDRPWPTWYLGRVGGHHPNNSITMLISGMGGSF